MENLAGFLSIGLLVIVQIAGVAYTYGKLSQKVDNCKERIDRLERTINNKPK